MTGTARIDMRAVPFAFVLALLLVGCGRGTDHVDGMADEASPMIAADSAKASAATTRGTMAGETGVRLASVERPVPVPRLIVRNAELTLRIENVEVSERKVAEVARKVGGEVEASQGADLSGPSPTFGITLRVPVDRFDTALARLEELGTRLGKTISTDDVTVQAVDLDARTKSLQVQEEAYRAILANAHRIADVLEVQERLTGVRTQIEEIVAQRRALGDQAARSKIVVTLQQAVTPTTPAPDPDWLAQTWGDATGALRAIGRGLASLALWLVALLPVWLPVTLVGIWARRRGRTRLRTTVAPDR